MINRVTIVGRITKDPVLRNSVNNKKFVAFTVVVNNLNDNPDYISCFAWNKTAENMTKFLKKGAMVGVDGSIHSRRVDRDGNNTTELFVTAMRVAFLDSKRNTTANTEFYPPPQPEPKYSKQEAEEPAPTKENDPPKSEEDEMISWK